VSTAVAACDLFSNAPFENTHVVSGSWFMIASRTCMSLKHSFSISLTGLLRLSYELRRGGYLRGRQDARHLLNLRAVAHNIF
jgi:hypothetical protein